MKIPQIIELLHRSSQRMMDLLDTDRDAAFWLFLRREIRLHFWRTVQLWWMVKRTKNKEVKRNAGPEDRRG